MTKTAVLIASGALIVSAGIASPAAAAPSKHVPGTSPEWLASAKHLGAAADGSAASARIWLAPKGGAAAVESAALAASTPGSTAYRRFLTPAQYRRRWAPGASAVQAVRRWATTFGLRVTEVGSGNDYVAVSGTVAQAEKAFSVSIERYSRDGRTVQAPTTALSLPAAILPKVLTVSGLDTTPVLLKPRSVPAGFRNAPPCSTSYGQTVPTVGPDGTAIPKFNGKQLPAAPCGYVGAQLRPAYEGRTNLTGAGVTIGILGAYASPTIASDAGTYAAKHGDGAYRPGQLTQTNPAFETVDGCLDPTEYYGEETLDIEASHAMASGANLHYYGVASCDDQAFVDTYRRILNENSVQIVSTSYGDAGEDVPAPMVIAETLVFARGALQGISFLNSSGDSGDEVAEVGTAQPDFPASIPFVTAVGGTATAIDASGRITAQTGWGTDKYSLSADRSSWVPEGFLYGSGGGTSSLFPKPAYQFGVVGGSRRVVPDMAMDGDVTTGFLIGETQEFPEGTAYDESRIGGTSLSSPLFAGMTALAVQAAGHRAGLLNPVIYRKRSSAFTDVLPNFPDEADLRVDFSNGVDASDGYLYSVRTFDDDSSLTTTPGYDRTTGVGTPNAAWLTALR